MGRRRRGHGTWLAWGGAALLAFAPARGEAAGTLQVSSATVNQQGEVGQICVGLVSGGEPIAGTQNDLVWDGTCATLASEASCQKQGTHGKDVKTKIQDVSDFVIKVLVLSLGDVDPIPNGLLYCCGFQSEADPGSCCNISVRNALGSDPNGNPVALNAGSGQICTRGSGAGGGGIGSIGGAQPPSASNAGAIPQAAAGGQGVAPAAPAAPAAPPAANVLPGGGVRVPEPAAPAAPAAPAVPPTAAGVAPAATAAAPAAVQPALAPPSQAPTAAATVAPTAPVPAETPTAAARPTIAPTARPTAPGKAAEKHAAPAAQGGWFGCQLTPDASPAPALLIALVLALGAAARRRAAHNH